MNGEKRYEEKRKKDLFESNKRSCENSFKKLQRSKEKMGNRNMNFFDLKEMNRLELRKLIERLEAKNWENLTIWDKFLRLTVKKHLTNIRKWGNDQDFYVLNTVLMEEIGEVSRALLQSNFVNLQNEIVDAVAVLLAMFVRNNEKLRLIDQKGKII